MRSIRSRMGGYDRRGARREVRDADSFQVRDNERVDPMWDGIQLTFAGILFATLVAVSGVLVATAPAWARGLWAVVVVALGASGLYGKRWVIRQVDRYLNWTGPRWHDAPQNFAVSARV